jgi:hypothetical protein
LGYGYCFIWPERLRRLGRWFDYHHGIDKIYDATKEVFLLSGDS